MGVKLVWSKNIYYGEKIGKHKKLTRFNIARGKTGVNTYLLSLPEGNENLLDIYKAMELKQKVYYGRKKYVVGIAGDKDEAISLAAMMIEDIQKQTGGLDTRNYFKF